MKFSSFLRDAPDIHRFSTMHVFLDPLPVGKSVNIRTFLRFTGQINVTFNERFVQFQAYVLGTYLSVTG